ncbi:MAG: hypothetical protein HYT61_01395 [Candidatus Yanofskybacteria bacterium]|nr:hypothetical protein [Candidatus Yanofskybacteria bacterium]
MPFPKLDPKKVRQLPLSMRRDKMTFQKIKYLDEPVPSINSPEVQQEINGLAKKIAEAHRNNRPVIWMTGDHVTLRRGNQRYLIDLMERGIVTHLAGNGAVPIHDFELALIGSTLEDVEFYIRDGKFGNWDEVGFAINEAAKWAAEFKWGFGETIGWMIENDRFDFKFPHKDISIFAAAHRLGIPATVHVLIGADIVHQHPNMDGAATGQATYTDLLIFARALRNLEGGVFLNLGTAVHGPEVYLKALSMARNVELQEGRENILNFTTAVFDILDLGNWRESRKEIYDWRRDMKAMDNGDKENLDSRYYFRPGKTILTRTVAGGFGQSFYIRGDCGITVPNLYQSIMKELG